MLVQFQLKFELKMLRPSQPANGGGDVYYERLCGTTWKRKRRKVYPKKTTKWMNRGKLRWRSYNSDKKERQCSCRMTFLILRVIMLLLAVRFPKIHSFNASKIGSFLFGLSWVGSLPSSPKWREKTQNKVRTFVLSLKMRTSVHSLTPSLSQCQVVRSQPYTVTALPRSFLLWNPPIKKLSK